MAHSQTSAFAPSVLFVVIFFLIFCSQHMGAIEKNDFHGDKVRLLF